LREAAGMADAIITTGGVSVGEAGFRPRDTARLGEIHFWKLKIKPGRPMAFGKIGNAWLFGLPAIRSRSWSITPSSHSTPCSACPVSTRCRPGPCCQSRPPMPSRNSRGAGNTCAGP
jgi:hypothetical protein